MAGEVNSATVKPLKHASFTSRTCNEASQRLNKAYGVLWDFKDEALKRSDAKLVSEDPSEHPTVKAQQALVDKALRNMLGACYVK